MSKAPIKQSGVKCSRQIVTLTPASVLRPTLLYINFRDVIPANSGNPAKNTGFRVKPGMTNKVKTFMTHYTRCGVHWVKVHETDVPYGLILP